MKHGLTAIAAGALLFLGCGTEITRDESGGGGSGAGAGGSGTAVSGGTGGAAPTCAGVVTSDGFTPGAYFFLADFETPTPTQVQLLAWFDIDPDTGLVTGRFTNADRAPGSTCDCDDTQACSSLEQCVLPSTKAGTEDEYADFLVPRPDPPTGYSFTTTTCPVDQPDGTVAFATAPIDLAIEQPPVKLVGLRITAQLAVGGGGVVRGRGTVEADQVILGETESGPARGAVLTRTIPEAEVPADLPKP